MTVYALGIADPVYRGLDRSSTSGDARGQSDLREPANVRRTRTWECSTGTIRQESFTVQLMTNLSQDGKAVTVPVHLSNGTRVSTSRLVSGWRNKACR